MGRMTVYRKKWIRQQPRFRGMLEDGQKFDRQIRLSRRIVYEEEKAFICEAIESGYDESQINSLKNEIEHITKRKFSVPVHAGMDALHLAVKLAAEKLYGSASGISTPEKLGKEGSLYGKRVFISDFAPAYIAFPVLYEGGEPIFIDCGDTDWSMDPEVLYMAFQKYPDVQIVIFNHAYVLEQVLKGNRPELSSCDNMWNFLEISDCVKMLILLAESDDAEGIYHIASKDTRVLREYVEELRDLAAPKIELGFGYRKTDRKRTFWMEPDITKLLQIIGKDYEFVSFRDGVMKLKEEMEKKKDFMFG